MSPERALVPEETLESLRYFVNRAKAQEWRWQAFPCPRGCCADHAYACASCGGQFESREDCKHDSTCELVRQLTLAESFLDNEERLQEELRHASG